VRSSSLSTNTVVIFMGDNGFMMGRRGMHGKYVPYDDSLRVPMIAWGPDSIVGTRGTTVSASVNSLDLPPTFVRIAGGTPPDDWTGRDATPVLKDGQPHEFTYAVSSYPDHYSLIDHVEAYRVIRTPEYKLIEWHPAAELSPEFYDLVRDPAENTNLYGRPEVADVQAKLKSQLDAYRAKTGDDRWDMQGPLGMFEPERLNWTYDEGPKRTKPRTRPAGLLESIRERTRTR
jgi:arylsulfatase A-like enzyme